jgi:hypothetical protein
MEPFVGLFDGDGNLHLGKTKVTGRFNGVKSIKHWLNPDMLEKCMPRRWFNH